MKSFPDLFEEVYFFTGYEVVSSVKCVTTTDVPATGGTTTGTMMSTTTSTTLTTTDNESSEKLKYSVEKEKSDQSYEFDSEGHAAPQVLNDTTHGGDIETSGSSTTSSSTSTKNKETTKATIKPTENRVCNGPPCLTPYVTTVRSETRDFHRILKDLNNNYLDSQSSDFLIRK